MNTKELIYCIQCDEVKSLLEHCQEHVPTTTHAKGIMPIIYCDEIETKEDIKKLCNDFHLNPRRLLKLFHQQTRYLILFLSKYRSSPSKIVSYASKEQRDEQFVEWVLDDLYNAGNYIPLTIDDVQNILQYDINNKEEGEQYSRALQKMKGEDHV
ncbi:MAG: hypothetical protein ACRC0X_02060 [Brevinema sp.]